MKHIISLLCLVMFLVCASDALAKLSGKDRSQIKNMLHEILYLRTDVPTNNGVEPFIEISPTGYSWERLVSMEVGKAKMKNKPSGVYWPFRPNDIVKWGSPNYNGSIITVWFEGIKDELKVIFVSINTIDDFKRAFDHVFSQAPLQDESSWPAEIRIAITERRLIEGMTRKQASCVVGTPLKTETSGAETEIWYPRQDTGDRRRGRMTNTGLPKKLAFVNDKLTSIEK
jgi:hypothetical protein